MRALRLWPLWLAAGLATAGCGTGAPAPAAPRARPSSPPTPSTATSTATTEAPVPKQKKPLDYPATRRTGEHDVLHGVLVPDPYRWLEREKDEQVQKWMAQQDALARAELGQLPEREALRARLKELFYLDALSAPQHRGKRYFYTRQHATKEKRVVYFKEGKKGAEKLLLDPNSWSPDGSISLGGWHPSWDGRRVAYQQRQNNSDEATLYVLDIGSGKRLDAEAIAGGKYASASWTPDGQGFYYTWLPTDPGIPTAERPGYAEVRFHALGTDPAKDALVHERTGNPSTFIGSELSQDGHWLVLGIYYGWTANDLLFRDLRPSGGKPAPGAFRPLVVGNKSHYEIRVYRDRFYVMSDEGAPRWRVFEIDPLRPERTQWKEIVPERPDATLEGYAIVGGRLGLRYLKNAASSLEIRELDGRLVREVELPGIGTVDGPIGRPDEDEAYFGFDSFTTPPEIWVTSVKTGKTELYSRVKVPVDPSPYLVEQVFYPSKDGTRISMFIVRRKDAPLDGSARMLLTGYGGFQVNRTPEFMAVIYPWLERGGSFALPNLRGGGEYGEGWHRAGMLLAKQNVFDDFIAAAEYLIDKGYTRPERLVLSGGSNGGLLLGAAIVQRPELFGVALCSVPLIDMVRYHLFGSGKTWVSEYGSADDPAQFRALFAYSPYHHVVPGTRYPATLLLSADADDRVDPMHARKFAAALQAASRGGPVLLRIERHSGHTGADLIKAEVEKAADRYAFALLHTGAAAARGAK